MGSPLGTSNSHMDHTNGDTGLETLLWNEWCGKHDSKRSSRSKSSD